MRNGSCLVRSCNQREHARGWCIKHYKHWHRFGDPLPRNRRPGGPGMPGGTCSIEGCEEPYYCRTWCRSHYWRWRRNGDPLGGNRSPRATPIITARDAPSDHQLCVRCGLIQSFSEFYKDASTASGFNAYCKRCANAHKEKQRVRDPERFLALQRVRQYKHHLNKRYGLTVEEYERLLDKQGGVCRICKEPETALSSTGSTKVMAVDHDHGTGRVRGLLCTACNQGLGSFRDDVGLLSAAICYLKVNTPI